ncbi:hypothetical protein LKD77_22720, partial [Enterobacteriaceae bacterium CLA-AA-H239]|nr:hypothetical protein [Shigella sp. CLA-AA-H239]
MNAEHTDYGWLFREPDEETDGDIMIDLEHLPQELKLGHCCKVSDEAAFCLIQRPYISKTLL